MDGRNNNSKEDGVGKEDAGGSVKGNGQRKNKLKTLQKLKFTASRLALSIKNSVKTKLFTLSVGVLVTHLKKLLFYTKVYSLDWKKSKTHTDVKKFKYF